ncbi:MAG: DUF2779 domain-containing protein [Pyrinomonadaceae bacterium]
MIKISKSEFKNYLACPREFWLSRNKPEFAATTPDAAALFRFNQGQEVEDVLKKYLEDRADQDYEFQKTVQTDDVIARFDVFVLNAGDGGAHIYEVKSSKAAPASDSKRKAKREEFAYDLGFQVFAAREAGIKVSKAILVALNPEYVLAGDLEPEELFVFDDMTDDVNNLQDTIREQVSAARECAEEEPTSDLHEVCDKKLKCEFIRWKFPEIPELTIFNIPRLSVAKRNDLLDMDVLDIYDVPDDYKLTEKQREFIDFVKAGALEIDVVAIRRELSQLKYPLYFLDYETANPSIPQFEGMHPLAQITFQYSLHVRREPLGELEHYEFLSDGSGEVPHELAADLRENLGETGSVIVWYKHFEMGRNNEMAELYPEFKPFFDSVNSRIFDLYEIFSKGLYRDPAFESNSIKNVLPVLVPIMSYENLEIGNGALASANWYQLVYKAEDEEFKAKTMDDLRVYCTQDTIAMVEILDVLNQL